MLKNVEVHAVSTHRTPPSESLVSELKYSERSARFRNSIEAGGFLLQTIKRGLRAFPLVLVNLARLSPPFFAKLQGLATQHQKYFLSQLRISRLASEKQIRWSSTRHRSQSQKSRQPRVTIIVTVHNQPPNELEACFRGIEKQAYRHYDVVVVDDGSTSPASLSFLKAYAASPELPPNWVFLRQANSGVIGARNYGLENARGEWICFHDPDDELFPLFLSTLAGAILAHEQDPRLAIVHSDVLVRATNGSEWIWKTKKLAKRVIAYTNSIPVTCLVKRSEVLNVGGFDEAFSRGIEDWGLWAELAARGLRSIRIAEPLYIYNVDGKGRSASEDSNTPELRAEVRKRALRVHPRRSEMGGLVQKHLTLEKTEPEAPCKSGVVFFVPFLLKTGGAELFFQVLADGLVQLGYEVVFVLTHPESRNHWEGKYQMSRITSHIYDLSSLTSRKQLDLVIQSIFLKNRNLTVFNAGSLWHYQNVGKLEESFSSRQHRNFALLFNHGLHAGHYLVSAEHFEGAVTVYEKLADALRVVNPGKSAVPITVGTLDKAEVSEAKTQRRKKVSHVGWLGRMDADKNPHLFVDIATAWEGKTRFSMAGSGPELETVKARVESSGSISVLGHVADALDYLRSLDALVITSNIEGISNVAVEAIALGVPVISTDVGGMSELIKNGVNGYLYPKSSADALAEILISLLENSSGALHDLKKSTALAGLPSSYTREAMVSRYEELLNSSDFSAFVGVNN
jgi:glycosyltransferase involved in cell wall biosynthesis